MSTKALRFYLQKHYSFPFLFFFFCFLEGRSLGKEHTEIFLLCKGFDTSPKFCLLLSDSAS